MRDEKEKN